MKICIPIKTNNGKDSQVCEHFGSAPFFLIYDDKDDAYEIVVNKNQHHSHGMCHPMKVLNGRNIDIVVCGGIGARAVQLLNMSGIKAYYSEGETVLEIVNKIKNNKLEEITVNNACARHSCN